MKYAPKLIKAIPLTCGSLLLSPEAFAGELPRYDVASYCDEVAEVSGRSHRILKGCVDMELRESSQQKTFKY